MALIVFAGSLIVSAVAQGTTRRAGRPVSGVPVFAGISIGTSAKLTA